MNFIIYYFLYFMVMSIIGYIVEVTYVYLGTKKIINRGFLHGPVIPIYGVGSLLITYLLTGYYNDSIVVFVFSLIICASIEYFFSFLMEEIFHQRWWDYSTHKYNVNGRICLKNSILFGIAGMIIIYIINPIILDLLLLIPYSIQRIAFIITISIFIGDLSLSIIEATRLVNIVDYLDIILNEYVKNKNIRINKIRTRLIKSYPYLISNKRVLERLEKLKKDFKHFKKKNSKLVISSIFKYKKNLKK